MAKDEKILVIDVGGDTLKMAEFNINGAGVLLLEKFGFASLENPEDANADPMVLFREALLRLIREKHFVSKRVRLTISGAASFSRLSKLPPLGGDGGKVEKIVEFEAKQTVPYPMDEVLWDYQLIRNSASKTDEDAQQSGADVVPTGDDDSEFEALFVAVKKEVVSAYTDILLDAGKEVVSVEIAPVALFNAARATQSRGSGCDILLNIGGKSTSLIITERNRIFVRTIPIAGDSITQQIAKEFAIGLSEADEMKRRHGFVALGGAYEEPDSEVAATISKVARNVMTRLHGEVSRSINVWRSMHGGGKPQRVFISGGGSLMIYVSEFFNEKLHLPVDYLNVFSAISISPSVEREELLAVAPMFPELIGMALHEVAPCPVDIELIPETIRLQKVIQKKVPFFYASMGTVLVCLCFFFFGVNRRLAFDRNRVGMTKNIVSETQALSSRVKDAYRAVTNAQNGYAYYHNILNSRGRWVHLMEDLQQRLPDTTFLVSLSYEDPVGMIVQPRRKSTLDAQAGEGDMSRGGGEGQMGAGPMGGGPMGDGPMGGGPMGAGPMGGGPMGDGMAGPVAEASKPAAVIEVKELILMGYSLNLEPGMFHEKLNRNLESSPYFQKLENTDIGTYRNASGENNLTTFEIKLKLKNPLKLAVGA
ncbi:MAG: pilus assembly protein PilM [Victivallaceae bacterium]|nr:pilus assembly protein PilM [Victivallaceae bacterium]